MTVSVDAAGRFVKKIRSGGELTSHIFLYIISTSIVKKVYPIFQFISEYQASNFIKHCFDIWLNKGSSVPRECVMDHSKALLNATCLSFNKCTYKYYLAKVYQNLSENTSNSFDCYIRIDIAHLIKSVTRWKRFKECEPRVKDFYLRIIGRLSKTTSVDEFMKIIRGTFIVCQNPKKNIVQNSLELLFDLIQSHEIEQCKDQCQCDKCKESNPEQEVDEDDIDEQSIDSQSSLMKRTIRQIIAETSPPNQDEKSDHDYYCPNFAVNFSVLCEEFIAWTNVATEFFDSKNLIATSGRSEYLFSDLRHITGINRSIACHLFLAIYINFLKGSINLGKAFTVNKKLLPPIITNTETFENLKLKLNSTDKDLSDFTTETVEEKKDFIRGKYLEPFEDVKIHHTRPHLNPFKTVIVNGNLRAPLKYKNQYYFYSNSCMFDSVFELIGGTYVNYGFLKEFIQEFCLNSDCLFYAVSEYFKSGKEKKLYQNRLKICVENYDIDKTTMTLSYNKDVGTFLQSLFQNCSFKLFYVKIEIFGTELLNAKHLGCYLKNQIKSKLLDVEKFLFINIEDFFKNDQICSLKDLPEKISINKKVYSLTGMITSKPSNFNPNLIHYVCLCRNYRNRWCLKDDLITDVQWIDKSNNYSVKPIITMYVRVPSNI